MSRQREQMINNMLHEIAPSYDSLNEVSQQEMRDLAAQYLESNISEADKVAIINKLKRYESVAQFSGTLHKCSNATPVQPQFGAPKLESGRDIATELIALCYATNETILRMQNEQQEVLRSLVSTQGRLIERDEAMVEIIKTQQNLIESLQKKCQTQQEVVELMAKERELYKEKKNGNN